MRSPCWSACPRKSRTTNTASASCLRRCANSPTRATRSWSRPAQDPGAGLPDADYQAAGAAIVADADAVYGRAELIVKVKEPLAAERKKLRRGQVLFAYLHLAPDREQTEDLLQSGVTAIAYETVTGPQGTLPLLTPMSEVAGRMAPHVGARCLEKENGGRGVLLAGVPGVPPASVVILGGGVAGTNAALIASGMGAEVAVLDRNPEALRRVDAAFGGRVRTLFSTRDVVEMLCRRADLVIATVLVPGATAPKLISAQTVKAMKPGAVIVDVAIDQGGCAETSRPTTHSHPTYMVDDVVHYCVANMPGAVARTSTFALSNVTTVVRARARRQGLAAGARRRCASARWAQRPRRPHHLPRRRRSAGLPYTPAEQVLRV